MNFTFEPIGIIHSCYKEKFGIPRQARLVPAATATLELLPPYNRPEALTGLADFSHVWLLFVFHQNQRAEWRPTVRPPRLGGNQRLGVFATRAPYRPNPLGLSAVKLEQIRHEAGQLLLYLSGIDLLDGTPILDIKPYLPYADQLPMATAGFAPAPPAVSFTVDFNPAVTAQLTPEGRALIVQTLQQDPRPAYKANQDQPQQFAMKLLNFDVKWQVHGEQILVTALEPLPPAE